MATDESMQDQGVQPLKVQQDMEAIFGRPRPGIRPDTVRTTGGTSSRALLVIPQKPSKLQATSRIGRFAVAIIAFVSILWGGWLLAERSYAPAPQVVAYSPQQGPTESPALAQTPSGLPGKSDQQTAEETGNPAFSAHAPDQTDGVSKTSVVANRLEAKPSQHTDRYRYRTSNSRHRDGRAGEDLIGTRCGPITTRQSSECWADELASAHRRLTAAYENAGEAGVPIDEMRRYRSEWDQARKNSQTDPQDTVKQFDGLTSALQGASQSPEDGEQPPQQ